MTKNYDDIENPFGANRRPYRQEREHWARLQRLIADETPLAPPRSKGPTKRAGIIEEEVLKRIFAYIDATSASPEIHRLKVLLSSKAGLRVSEIAGLRLKDVTDVDGGLDRFIRVPDDISKGGRGRVIPMHPDIAKAIRAFQARYPDIDRFGISHVKSVIKPQSVNSLTCWFHRLYKQVGLQGCSSHSGRRTFITKLARRANDYNNSLRDVQVLAGHARLDTTELYIEPSDNVHDLVNSLGSDSERERERQRKLKRDREQPPAGEEGGLQ